MTFVQAEPGTHKYGRYSSGTHSNSSPNGPLSHLFLRVADVRAIFGLLTHPEGTAQALLMSQILIVLSYEHDTMDCLSGVNTTEFTQSMCPCSVASGAPVDASHRRTF